MLRFEKTERNLIKFKYHLNEENFHVINVCGDIHCNIASLHIKPAYNTRLPISTAKKKDLLYLLKTKVIPESYANFYNDLPSSTNQPDRLPEPSNEEEECVDDAEDNARPQTASLAENEIGAEIDAMLLTPMTLNAVTSSNVLHRIENLQSEDGAINSQRTRKNLGCRTPINGQHQGDDVLLPSNGKTKRRRVSNLVLNETPPNHNEVENMRPRARKTPRLQLQAASKTW